LKGEVMNCPRCKLEIPDDAEMCGHCRKRIKASPLLVICGLLVAALVLLAVIANTIGDTAAPSTARGRTANTITSCVCVTDYDAVAAMLRGYRDGDTAALYGLVARGQGVNLSSGTAVHVVSRNAGLATVLVESGAWSGQRCHLWGKFLE
jgi:hypothetical protein